MTRLLSILLSFFLLLMIIFTSNNAHANSKGIALQQQIEQATTGATILLEAGVYQGNFIINKPLTLKGVSGAVLDGNKQGHVVLVNASDVTLQNLKIQHSGHNLTDLNAGVFVARSAKNVTIKDNHFYFNAFGMWLDLAENATVLNNRIQGNPAIRSQDRGNGIHLFSVKNALVEGNEIWQTRDAIYIDTSNHNILKNNTMYDLRYGVHYMYSYHNKVLNNYSHHTRSGYALMQSKYLTVIGNRSENDDNYGILMNFITHSTIKNNTVIGVKRGGSVGLGLGGLDAEGKAVFIYNSLYNKITHNTFQDSSIGIHLTAGSEDNTIHHNAFIRNHTQVKYVANRKQEWSAENKGNYWTDYLGWDRDNNGVGDQPYIPNDNIDKLLWKYPLAKVLMHSPAVETLHYVQQQFPLLRSVGIRDSFPLMQVKQ